METRSDWHGVYIDLIVFAEYAVNNPSSAYDLYLGIGSASTCEILHLRSWCAVLMVGFQPRRSIRAFQERGCPSGHIADAISSRLDVIPELTTIKKADLWALG
jgi:hypothetical protein